ncbi:MAG: phage holin family protein [Actinomycetota bacterium]|nr:phage holin family protein [Actinomycetota bacterium]
MTTTGTRPSTEDYYRNERPGNRSVGQLMREITEDISTLFRKEIELAKQEVGESIAVKAKGAVIIAIAGLFGLLALMFVLLALRDGFDTFLWTWVADLATALVLLVCGGIGALVAKKKLQAPFKTELTKKTIKDDVELAKSLRKRPGGADTSTGV